MGDWTEDRNHKWIYDPAAPTPGSNPAVTQMLPIVGPSTDPVDVPPRVDGWCEDRPPAELSDNDGQD